MIGTRVRSGAFAGFLLVLPTLASAGPVSSFPQLAGAVRPGDVLAVTLWSGREHSGPVAALTGCSLTIVSHGERVTFEGSAIRKIRRMRRGNAGSKGIADAARSCGDVPCTAMSMAFSAGAALARGFRLFGGAPTVYRAEERPPSVTACVAPAPLEGVKPDERGRH